MFPVGFVAQSFVSTPVIDVNGTFVGFYDGWPGNRKYMVDMAGFAINLSWFLKVSTYGKKGGISAHN